MSELRWLPAGRFRQLIRALVTAAIFGLPLVMLVTVVRSQWVPLHQLDEKIAVIATDFTRERSWLRDAFYVWQAITQPSVVYTVATVVCLWVLHRHAGARAWWAFLTMMVGWNLALQLKILVQRHRPDITDPVATAQGYSFPSGHVSNATIAATAVVLLLLPLLDRRRHRLAMLLAAGFCLITGIDRIYLGQHYFSDVIAGVVFGLGYVLASYAGFLGGMAPAAQSLRPHHHQDAGDAAPHSGLLDQYRLAQERSRKARRWGRRFILRYERDSRRPPLTSALRDLAVRAIAPGLVVFGAVVGIGLLIMGPLGSLRGEELVNREFRDEGSGLLTTLTMVWSRIGNTEIIIGTCLVMIAILWWRSKQWWWACLPGIAISLQASIFVAATSIADRPRPVLEHLDPAPPTSSYPSGHVGAATALYVTFALQAQRISNRWVRQYLTIFLLIVPVLVAYARVYRGMHHVSDVIAGAANGLSCAVLAWNYLRREADRDSDDVAEPASDPGEFGAGKGISAERDNPGSD